MAQESSGTDTRGDGFGDYVVSRQLAVEENTIIYRARKADAPAEEKAEKFVVVVYRCLNSPQEAEQDGSLQTLVQDLQLNFLEAVKLQKKARESGASAIVPIHDFGLSAQGAWYATDYYPRGFLKKWVTQRAGVTEEELRHVIAATIEGLIGLKQHCQRSHGNLTPSSMLIGGKLGTPLRVAPIILTYLQPGDAKDGPRFELADLKALGQIIYQLVCRQEITAFNQDNYPLPPSDYWVQLGKHGDFWREVCNRLLDPGLSLQSLTLEKLAVQVQPARSAPGPALGAVAAVVVVLAAGAFFWFRPQPAPKTTFPPPASATQTQAVVTPMPTNETRPPTINTPPRISLVPDQVAELGQPLAPIPFTIGDAETPVPGLRVTAASSNPSLIPTANIVVAGTGAERTVRLEPAAGQAGTAMISLVVNDGELGITNRFNLTIKKAYAAPLIGDIGDQTVKVGTPSARYKFQVSGGDAADSLFVAGASANPAFLPDTALKISGTGPERTLVIDPVPKQAGEVIVAVSVADGRTNVTKTFWFKVAP